MIEGRTTGGEAQVSPFLEVMDVVGESPVMKVRFNGVELACLIAMGSQVMTIARPIYEAQCDLGEL